MSRKILLLVGALAFAGTAAVFGESETTTALGALKLLPKGAAAKVAIIEAREGHPTPDRWHILVHDPNQENGLHEYVIANGEIVASRGLSQFAELITSEDVIAEPVRIDSDRLAKLAQLYADANRVRLAQLNFELKREGEGAAPLWNVGCVDERGNEFARIVLTATKGTILSHDGFAIDPPLSDKTKWTETALAHADVFRPDAGRSDSSSSHSDSSRADSSHSDTAGRPEPVRAEPIAERRSRRPDFQRRPDTASRAPEDDHRSFFQRAGGTLQRLFNGQVGH
jgi:hypothetical protein